MVKFTVLTTLAALALTATAGVPHYGNADRRAHHELGMKVREASNKHARGLSRRCSAPSNSTSSSAVVENTTQQLVATSSSVASSSSSSSSSTEAATTSSKNTATSTSSSAQSSATSDGGSHVFTLKNSCSDSLQALIVNTAGTYSGNVDAASAGSYTGDSPTIAAGETQTVSIPYGWVGRVCAQTGKCGDNCEDCTMAEFTLDANSIYTPQTYDLSNIQGFTLAMSLGAEGCDTVTCTSQDCGCENAYPIGDLTGCGNDQPVKACSSGNKAFTLEFCAA